MMRCVAVLCLALAISCAVTAHARAEDILTPSAGAATGSAYFPLDFAFDSQPAWSAASGMPTGGGTAGGDAPYYAGRAGFIDFGENWMSFRITQTWTMYRTNSSGIQTPYTLAWWDDDKDMVNDDGVVETLINFNTARVPVTGWLRDVDCRAAPVRPQRRYLIMCSPNPMTNRAKEYAIVGNIYSGSNTPPVVSAGENRRTVLSEPVTLDGAVSDDGLLGPMTVVWTKLSGPGDVSFEDAADPTSVVDFTAEGAYVLRLAASDGETTSYDEMMVVVNPAPPVLTLAEPQVFDFDELTLVDQVNCGDPNDSHALYESVAGISGIQTILGDECRVLADDVDEPAYFGYILGAGRGLVAGKAYVLVVEYPEDAPRSMVVVNHGCETNRGFHTGRTVGDCLTPLYVGSNPESLNYGFSQDYRQWQQLFHLHDRFPDVVKPRGEGPRPKLPADGFQVFIGQYAAAEDPLSLGAAVKRIALYEAPSLAAYTQPLAELPAGLPKRHLFWREEMSDGVLGGTDLTQRGVAKDVDWFEYKARLHKFLGMNTFAKDLLEFGHCQGWDVSLYGGHSSDWFNRSSTPFRWEEMLVMLAKGGYGLDVLPYYEYAGGDGGGEAALGKKKRCIPLGRDDGKYTHITWSENINIDVSDPEAVIDATRMLQETITALDQGNRPIPIPIKGNGNPTWKPAQWGYIDFGANWQDVRICQTWTQSRLWHGGPASPFSLAYWHSTTAGFSGDTVPPTAIRENTVNFLTQPQVNGADRWGKDIDVTSSPITPKGRYLVMRSGSPLTDCAEFLIVGYLNGQGTQLRRIPVTAGQLTGYTMQSMFDNQTEFNTIGVNFVGAWLRPRISAIPMGFAEDSTLLRYSDDRGITPSVTRAAIKADAMLKADYYAWWYDQRKAFLNALRDYLRTNAGEDSIILYTWDSSESGVGHPSADVDVVTDDVSTWAWYTAGPMSYGQAVSSALHLNAMKLPAYNWSTWEWPHSIPRGDGLNYQDNEGVMMEYVFNKLYTVADPAWFDEYRTQSGLACIRHYCLNENMMTDTAGTELVGYFVSDMEVAGPYCMLPEARALANGDPYYFGYLSSNSYNRGFPGYVREFNANFLALPAIPSTVVAGAATDSEVIVRRIDTAANGTWLAIVNTSMEDKRGVVVSIPVAGPASDAVTGSAIAAANGTITLDLWPGQLKSIRVGQDVAAGLPGDFNGDGLVTQGDYTIWADHFGLAIADIQALGTGLFPAGSYPDGATTVTHGLYTVWADHFGETTQQPLSVQGALAPQVDEPAPAVTDAPVSKAKMAAAKRAERIRLRREVRAQRAAQRQARK